MSDTRFTLIGVGFIFVGFIVLGVFGSQFFSVTVESQEFTDCYEYFEDSSPVPIPCDVALHYKTAFFGLVIALIGAGVFSLIKGVKGNWDQKVKPEDMLGPGAGDSMDSENKDSDKPNNS
jgi:hypothetical protein